MTSDTPAPWRILLDCQMTRRKRWHIVLDPEGDCQFSSPKLEACLTWLRDADVYACLLMGDEWVWHLELSPLGPSPKG